MNTTKKRLIGIAAPMLLVAALLTHQAANAQTATPPQGPSPQAGRELSEKLCNSCHLIGGEASTPAPVGPPSFASIANIPGMTAEHIRNVLIKPHTPMPDMQLTNIEMLNIISYLQTLRTGKDLPPMLPPNEQEKMKFPAPT